MNTHISSLLGALLVTLPISLYAGTSSPCMASALNSYFSGRPHFHAFSFSVVGIIGLLFLTVGNRHSQFARFAEWVAPKLGGFYASAGGTVLGWGYGACVAHLLAAPLQNWLPALAVAALATLVVVPTLVGLHAAAPVAIEFRDRWEKPIWQVRFVQAVGLVLLITAVVAAWAQFAA